jgi:hypothetical protein
VLGTVRDRLGSLPRWVGASIAAGGVLLLVPAWALATPQVEGRNVGPLVVAQADPGLSVDPGLTGVTQPTTTSTTSIPTTTSTTVATTSTTTAAVLGAAADPGSIARTGANDSAMAVVGLGMLLAGGGLTFVSMTKQDELLLVRARHARRPRHAPPAR